MSSNQDYNGPSGYGQQSYAPPQNQGYAQDYSQDSYGKSAGRMMETEADDGHIAPPPPPRYDEPIQPSRNYGQQGGYGEQPQQVCLVRSPRQYADQYVQGVVSLVCSQCANESVQQNYYNGPQGQYPSQPGYGGQSNDQRGYAEPQGQYCGQQQPPSYGYDSQQYAQQQAGMPERNPSPNPAVNQEEEGKSSGRKGLLGGLMGGGGGEGEGNDKRKKMMMMAMMGTCNEYRPSLRHYDEI